MSVFKKKWLITISTLVVGIVLVWLLASGRDAPEQTAPAAVAPVVVEVVTVTPGNIAPTIHTQGTVMALREIDLVAQVGGRMAFVSDAFASGGYFAKGETLAALEDLDYRAALAQARSQLAQAQQQLASEKGLARQARREWRDLGNAEANDLFLRKPQLVAAEALVGAAEAGLDLAELNLRRTQFSVPFNARVLEVYADLGQFVSAGSKVARLIDTDAAELRLPLTDRQLMLLDLPVPRDGSAITQSLEARVTVRFAGRDWQWPAGIVRTEAAVDPASRVFYAVARIESPFVQYAGSNRPPMVVGQFAEVSLQARLLNDVIVLPREALIQGRLVWQVQADNTLRQVAVEWLHSDADQVTVRGDFVGEQRIVAAPLVVMADGMVVDPVPVQMREQH